MHVYISSQIKNNLQGFCVRKGTTEYYRKELCSHGPIGLILYRCNADTFFLKFLESLDNAPTFVFSSRLGAVIRL